MLRIKRAANGEVVLTVSGRMNAENVAELSTLFGSEGGDRRIVLDLTDLTLGDRDAVKFLNSCERDGIALQNCPAYICEWITRDRGDLAKDERSTNLNGGEDCDVIKLRRPNEIRHPGRIP